VTGEERLRVATSGTVLRDDTCSQCGAGMLYQVEEEKVIGSFCGDSQCLMFLVEIGE